MTALGLTLVIGIALLMTFAVGWIACWLTIRYAATKSDDSENADLHHQLYDAEQARDEALEQLESLEAAAASQLRQAEANLEAALDELGQARREAEYFRQLSSPEPTG
ncbi:MAG: hypothetical protein OXI81_05905 [Paracoccaceae bacterium]|nr:hypothetical protein [Paracoccaceae bacterium]MDE2913584.1 hypothetical protein [Paracoccaceae bacterium]